MNEMYDYIFKTIGVHSAEINQYKHDLKKQRRSNARLSKFIFCLLIHLIVNELQKKQQSDEINKLRKEIETMRVKIFKQ